ncbi:MAG TPA: deoxyribose-phosphate aldolase [Candidatus Limnocylindria bacterium]|nr:deoxyribose-phosphate aldolase [Candidatus Limnocylindria bacterium]
MATSADRVATAAELPTVPALARMIDHAVLKPTQTERDVVDACTLARERHIASVCVKPFYVADCARLLKGSDVIASTVIGFPHGGQAPEVKVSTALTALRDGARELDMVINIGALIERDYDTIEREIASVVGVGHANEALVKVILETAYLDDAQKAIAAQIAVAAGADFVKTSTGFGPEGATVEDVRLLRQVVGPKVGVKASGGIRTLDEALAMIEAGADRLGTSSTQAILDELRERRGET